MNSTTVRRRVAPAVMAGIAALVLSACGSDPDTSNTSEEPEDSEAGESAGESDEGDSSLSGTLNGAGASSQEAGVQAWIAGFQGLHPDVTVNYSADGSGAGREQFTSGAVPFAGTDAALDEEELAAAEQVCGGPAYDLPLYIDPIAVPYNLPGVDNLQLSPDTLAGIFNEQITTWNDPAIAEDNPDATLPDVRITPVHRSDESGTTENFVEYLAAAAPDTWPHEPDGNWPSGLTGEAGAQTPGVIQAVQAAEGAIGYASAAASAGMSTAAIGVGDEFVSYSAEAAAAVVDASPRVEGRNEHDIAVELARDTTASGAYPIVLISYTVVCSAYDDAETGELVKAWVEYVASPEGQEAAASAVGSAPISDQMRDNVLAAVDSIQVG